MTTRESLIESLQKIAKAHWQTKQQPVLLSNLPPLLVGNEPGYKDVLGTQSIKQFIKETEDSHEGQYKLVVHPNQPAKLGLVPLPEGEGFQFPETPAASTKKENFNAHSSEKALVDFLRALKNIPAHDLENVKIPVSVLVKMIR